MENHSLFDNDYFKLSKLIEQHHMLFYKMFVLGVPAFSDEMETACIRFDGKEYDEITFLFNKTFYDSLNDYEKSFIICHEILHIVLKHNRFAWVKHPKLANIASDIVVNHMLVNKFGFNRDLVPKNLCWADTVFPNETVPDNETAEFYYNKLVEASSDSNLLPIDSHEFMNDNIDPILGDIVDEVVNSANDDEKEDIIKNFGINPGNIVKKVDASDARANKKLSEVITDFFIKKERTKYKEQWVKTNRRYYDLLNDNLLLPTYEEVDYKKKEKIDIWFFLDTSGSCSSYAKRFLKVPLSMDKEKFNIKIYGFDIVAYEVKDSTLKGFGGTSFECIDRLIRGSTNNGKKHPHAIFVVTDGEAEPIHPEFPKKWYWFLTSRYASRYAIPKGSKIFYLTDFNL